MNLDVVLTWHRFLYESDPTTDQMRLYTSWPRAKGFSDHARDERRCEAVLVLGLLTGIPSDRVVLCVPVAHERWLLGQIERVAALAFRNSAAAPAAADEVQKRVADFVLLFKRFVLASRVLRMEVAPAHWLSMGFSLEDPLPDWLRQGLLDGSPCAPGIDEDSEWPL